jgi:hypothetical protein
VDQSLEKDTAPLVNRAPNHIDGSERQELSWQSRG